MNTNTLPVLISQEEIAELREELDKPGLMGQTIARLQKEMDAIIAQPIDVPGHGEAGGYEHNKHKENYQTINDSGRLYLVTGDEKYAVHARNLLLQYAEKYLQMDFHIQRNTNPPGRLFHQILNEHMWLMYASLGYSCIASWLSDSERALIINQLFQPMLDMFTDKYDFDFDRIHNHGIGAVAAVGICGMAINKPEYVEMSVHGLKGDSVTGGFLAQISQLFAPSGYYLEGPYYHRFAIRPLCVFAEALHRYMPELDIFNYKDQVIRKTVQAMLATAYPNGTFPALNDASLTMGITDMGVQVAVSQCFKHYGFDKNLLAMANIQQQVWLNSCGLELSRAFEEHGNDEAPFWPSVELNEGAEGDQGAQGFIRMQAKDNDIAQLVMNYGKHGMGHGHFDTLGISYFNRGQEVLREYGFGRWVNVEPKFGGRYLDENKSYARQTIAHNAVTVDEQCQNQFDDKRADTVWGIPHFFMDDAETAGISTAGVEVQAMSAFANDHYENVGMQRTVVLLKDDELEAPLLVDLYRLTSETARRYDYSHQYKGQIVRTNFAYTSNQELCPLGENFGYQHLWDLARGQAEDSTLVSWLQDNSYYTWHGASDCNADSEIIFTQIGANDPSFNLRNDTSFILRGHGKNVLFASALETHGYFNEAVEASTNARGNVAAIKVLGHNSEGSVIQVELKQRVLTIMVSNNHDVTSTTRHQIELNGTRYQWNGFMAITGENK